MTLILKTIKQQNQSKEASVYNTLVDFGIKSALMVNWSTDLRGLNLALFLDGFIIQANLF